MYLLADVADAGFEHAVGGRVGHHQAGQRVAVGFDLRVQVGHVDVALLVAGHHHDLQPGQLGRGRVGAVGRGRNQAHLALWLALRQQVLMNGLQPGILALCTGVGLERHARKAGDVGQPPAQLRQHGGIALRLAFGGEGVDVGKGRPGDGGHLGSGIELHGARAQRDHRMHQRDVAVFQPLQVADEFRFAVEAVEHLVRQHGVGAQQAGQHVAVGSLSGGQVFQRPDRRPGCT